PSPPDEHPTSSPAPAAPTSKLLLRGPDGARDGRLNDTADVLGESYEQRSGAITVPVKRAVAR
ncbi:hypothetical protein, partial [Streptomyces griseiscabiei]|uniref:hypothetical protein n=1 Tax=Streptomyces griseiscabiei TaxID=2993540 RepID=UPI001C4F1F60